MWVKRQERMLLEHGQTAQKTHSNPVIPAMKSFKNRRHCEGQREEGKKEKKKGRRRRKEGHKEGQAYTGVNERTFIAIKPDGVQRHLVGEIIWRFEKKGFKLVAMKLVQASEDLLKEHYISHRGQAFYPRLIKYMSSGPVVAMVWQGLEVVKAARTMIGETNPVDAKPGTIRGDFCIDIGMNVIHGSDSVESAQREISLWFEAKELTCWEDTAEHWIYE
ncbi:nucleoside diphosphate kinase 3 [Anolis carolinensis]|uniref:nucleoside diphosphate kinase 3 n=1 Tax=Anolis carolinensis TaxID=28377 RepID=UPI002F2B5074